jgi:hypothetical protein
MIPEHALPDGWGVLTFRRSKARDRFADRALVTRLAGLSTPVEFLVLLPDAARSAGDVGRPAIAVVPGQHRTVPLQDGQ